MRYKEVKIGDTLVSVFDTETQKYVSLVDDGYLQSKGTETPVKSTAKKPVAKKK